MLPGKSFVVRLSNCEGIGVLNSVFPTKADDILISGGGFAPAQKTFSFKANPRQVYTNPLSSCRPGLFLSPAYLHDDSLTKVRNTLVSEPRPSWAAPPHPGIFR